MGDSAEETTEKISVLKAIQKLAARLDSFEHNVGLQFEAIRQAPAANSAAFDRLEATIYSTRSDVANLRADVKELTEELRIGRKVLA